MSELRGETHGYTRRCITLFRYVRRPIHLRLLPDVASWLWRRTFIATQRRFSLFSLFSLFSESL